MNQGKMKLEKFQNKGKKKQRQLYVTLGIVVVLLIAGVLIYRTYALYQQLEKYDAIKGEVPNFMDDYDVKVALTIDGVASTTFPAKGSGKAISSIECTNGATGAWDYTNWNLIVRNMSKTRTKCQVHFVTKHTDPALNGADPVLTDGLIPVTISNDGTVKKAKLGSEWYNYTNKQWANAVTLVDNTVSYDDGATIPENMIESYFVWIPRYRYKIFNDGNYKDQTAVENRVQTIEVVFETKDVNPVTGTGNGQWLTHPAFTNFNTNGLWVGKFETGYKGATSTGGAQVNSNDSGKIQIKPNVYSWRSVQVANAFTASYNYRRNMESHMMKNTEWGAVAFLQHSIYGSRESVRINNNSAYITGYSAVNEPTCGYTATNEDCNKYESTALNVDGNHTKRYNTATGYLASTTKNITGVYDMAGGAWEYVMGIMLDQSGKPMSGRNQLYNSGFNGTFGCPSCDTGSGNDASKTSLTNGIDFPDAKYYDTYAYATNDENYQRRILGDATGEMGPFATKTYGTQNRQIGSWYADEAWFVYHGNPWFLRGSGFSRGLGAGVFMFTNSYGHANGGASFRVVLAI